MRLPSRERVSRRESGDSRQFEPFIRYLKPGMMSLMNCAAPTAAAAHTVTGGDAAFRRNR
jgi:hypothetical protein